EVQRRLSVQMDWEAEVVRTLTPWQIANGLRQFMLDETSEEQAKKLEFDPKVMTVVRSSSGVPPLNLTSLRPFSFDAGRIMKEFGAARFYGSLSRAARGQLLKGNLMLSSLNRD